MRVLGDEVGEIFCRYYDVTDVGNFEQKNILHPTLELEQLARLFRREVDDITRLIDQAKDTLFDVREQRVKPGRDEKILTSWNGLMISAFAEAYKVLGNPDYREVARRGIRFIQTSLCHEGRMLRSYTNGQAKFNAYLDDYACFGAALLDVYEATFEPAYLDEAVAVADVLLERFWDAQEGGFFFTSSDHEALISRPKSAFDGSVPSGNSVAASVLLRLYYATEQQDYLTKAETIFRLFYDSLEQNPFGFSNMLCGLDFYLRRPKEIVLLGDPAASETTALLKNIHASFIPNKTLLCFDPVRPPQHGVPSFLEGKTRVDDKLTAYVCHNFACSLPVTSWEELRPLINYEDGTVDLCDNSTSPGSKEERLMRFMSGLLQVVFFLAVVWASLLAAGLISNDLPWSDSPRDGNPAADLSVNECCGNNTRHGLSRTPATYLCGSRSLDV